MQRASSAEKSPRSRSPARCSSATRTRLRREARPRTGARPRPQRAPDCRCRRPDLRGRASFPRRAPARRPRSPEDGSSRHRDDAQARTARARSRGGRPNDSPNPATPIAPRSKMNIPHCPYFIARALLLTPFAFSWLHQRRLGSACRRRAPRPRNRPCRTRSAHRAAGCRAPRRSRARRTGACRSRSRACRALAGACGSAASARGCFEAEASAPTRCLSSCAPWSPASVVRLDSTVAFYNGRGEAPHRR